MANILIEPTLTSLLYEYGYGKLVRTVDNIDLGSVKSS